MKYTLNTMLIFGEEQTLLHRHDDDGTVWGIPFADDNLMYQQYLAWLAEGGVPEPWNPDTINGGEE